MQRDGQGPWARLEFKVEDLWLGAFWAEKEDGTHLWLCGVPCLPLHVFWPKG